MSEIDPTFVAAWEARAADFGPCESLPTAFLVAWHSVQSDWAAMPPDTRAAYLDYWVGVVREHESPGKEQRQAALADEFARFLTAYFEVLASDSTPSGIDPAAGVEEAGAAGDMAELLERALAIKGGEAARAEAMQEVLLAAFGLGASWQADRVGNVAWLAGCRKNSRPHHAGKARKPRSPSGRKLAAIKPPELGICLPQGCSPPASPQSCA